MKSIHSILIANRGEIASRVIRTCRKMGIRSVAVYAEADRSAPYVKEADVAVCIGESNPSASYLDQDKLIATAQQLKADAIHPGYGFLSENADFSRRCEEEGIVFIGPNAAAIEAMGSKSNAKTLMREHGVPVVPGYQGEDQSVEKLKSEALTMGFPILLKATAGGGGKGMRIVQAESELEDAIAAAKRESLRAFGEEELIVEKYIPSGRHIEFQIFGDKHGQAIHILERECSIQRRYQKVMEESPSPVMDEALRDRMGEAAVQAAKALNYDNAGTVEFMYDDQSGDFYFLEVNTRLQVEHPVTEEITGLDLVQLQIESAQGLPLRLTQSDIVGNGYAIEVRLYAEDAANDFLPVTGTIHRFEVPEVEGLRVETAIESGSEISIFYDPMIAKLIVWDQSRTAAHRKLQYVLRHMVCQGMTTNQAFLLLLLQQPDVLAGTYDTHFIQDKMDLEDLHHHSREGAEVAGMAASLYGWAEREQARKLLRSMPSGWRNSYNGPQQETFEHQDESIQIRYRYVDDIFQLSVGEKEQAVRLIEWQENGIRMEVSGRQYAFRLTRRDHTFFLHNEEFGNVQLIQRDRFPQKVAQKIEGGYETPMPSQIIKVLVEEGQAVEEGTPLVIVSSMKMENTIFADKEGIVGEIYAAEGSNVEAGFLLLKLDPKKQ
ncbi:MAG: biotin carboxylase N-terminal domain-containing protein [Bacteroidota bacterium]